MRRCMCPCKRAIDPSSTSKYAHPPTCRPRYHRLKKETEGLTPRDRKLITDRTRKREARKAGLIPSDDRVSFTRAVTVLADYLEQSWPGDLGPPLARAQAVAEAREVLAAARPRRSP